MCANRSSSRHKDHSRYAAQRALSHPYKNYQSSQTRYATDTATMGAPTSWLKRSPKRNNSHATPAVPGAEAWKNRCTVSTCPRKARRNKRAVSRKRKWMWYSPCNKARISFRIASESLRVAFISVCFPEREYILLSQGGGIIKVTLSAR